jgi:hypothetical protein
VGPICSFVKIRFTRRDVLALNVLQGNATPSILVVWQRREKCLWLCFPQVVLVMEAETACRSSRPRAHGQKTPDRGYRVFAGRLGDGMMKPKKCIWLIRKDIPALVVDFGWFGPRHPQRSECSLA